MTVGNKPKPDLVVAVVCGFLRPVQPEVLFTSRKYIWHQRLAVVAVRDVCGRSAWEIASAVGMNYEVVRTRVQDIRRILPSHWVREWYVTVYRGCGLYRRGPEEFLRHRDALITQLDWFFPLAAMTKGTTQWRRRDFEDIEKRVPI